MPVVNKSNPGYVPGGDPAKRDVSSFLALLDKVTASLTSLNVQLEAVTNTLNRLATAGSGGPGVGSTAGLGNGAGQSGYYPGLLTGPAQRWASGMGFSQGLGLAGIPGRLAAAGPLGTVANLGLAGVQVANSYAGFREQHMNSEFPDVANFGAFAGGQLRQLPFVGNLAAQGLTDVMARKQVLQDGDMIDRRMAFGRAVGGVRAEGARELERLGIEGRAFDQSSATANARFRSISNENDTAFFTGNIIGQQNEQSGRLGVEATAARAAFMAAVGPERDASDRRDKANKELTDAQAALVAAQARAAGPGVAFNRLNEGGVANPVAIGAGGLGMAVAGFAIGNNARNGAIVDAGAVAQLAGDDVKGAIARVKAAGQNAEAANQAALRAGGVRNAADIADDQARAAMKQNRADVLRQEQFAGQNGAVAFGMMPPGMQQNLIESSKRIANGNANQLDFQLAGQVFPAETREALLKKNANNPAFREAQKAIGQRGIDEAGGLADKAQGEAARAGAAAAAAFAANQERDFKEFGAQAAKIINANIQAAIAELEQKLIDGRRNRDNNARAQVPQ